MFCEQCYALQRKDDVPYEVTFDFSQGVLQLSYFPRLLENKDTTLFETTPIFFSFHAVEYILTHAGYKVTDAKVIGNELLVAFQKALPVEKLRTYEEKLKSKYTYFLYAVKNS